MAAPASAAAIASAAISSGVTGRWGDIEGVWIEPVTAQVMIAFRCFAAAMSPPSLCACARLARKPDAAKRRGDLYMLRHDIR